MGEYGGTASDDRPRTKDVGVKPAPPQERRESCLPGLPGYPFGLLAAANFPHPLSTLCDTELQAFGTAKAKRALAPTKIVVDLRRCGIAAAAAHYGTMLYLLVSRTAATDVSFDAASRGRERQAAIMASAARASAVLRWALIWGMRSAASRSPLRAASVSHL